MSIDKDGRKADCWMCLNSKTPAVLHSDGFHYHGKGRCTRLIWRGSPLRKCGCANCRKKPIVVAYLRKNGNEINRRLLPWTIEIYPDEGLLQRRDVDCKSPQESIRVAKAMYPKVKVSK